MTVFRFGEWKFARWDSGHAGVWMAASNGEEYWYNLATFDAYCFEQFTE